MNKNVNKNNKIKILITLVLLVVFSLIAYISLPYISYGFESAFSDIENAVGKITQDQSAEAKNEIQEHRGYGIWAGQGSKAETKVYNDAAGNTGITDINSYIATYLSPKIALYKQYGWLWNLQYGTSVFCQEHGRTFPSLMGRKLHGFHLKDGTGEDNTIDTNEDVYTSPGALKYEDYTELIPDLACPGTMGVHLPDEYKDGGIEPKTTNISEKDILDLDAEGYGFHIKKFYQITTVRVRYTAHPRDFDMVESYIFSYSLRNWYTYNPAQIALWKHKNDYTLTTGRYVYNDADTNTKGMQLYKSAKAVDELSDPKKPKMSVTSVTDSNGLTYSTGTVLDGNYYKVGPILMEDYGYGWTEDIKQFSGESSLKNPANAELLSNKSETQKEFFKGLVAGIVEAKVTLDNGKEFVLDGDDFIIEDSTVPSGTAYYSCPTKDQGYEYPLPNSVFYIKLPIAECTGATMVDNITMKYKWHTADGNGGDLTGVFDELTWCTWKTDEHERLYYNSTKYFCTNTDGDGCACQAEGYIRSCYAKVTNADTSGTASESGEEATSGSIDYNINAWSHVFECGGSGWCKYGSEADSTKKPDVTPDENKYDTEITTECDSTWACGERPHKHKAYGDAVYDSYQLADGLDPVSCSCTHDHRSGCFEKDCVGDGTLICDIDEHTHGTGCRHYHSTSGCEKDEEGEYTCGYDSGELICDEDPHTHDDDCYHDCSGSSSKGTGCYGTQVCPHYPGTSSCPTISVCCAYDEHTHEIDKCGKTHDCNKTYCTHGFTGGKHNCYVYYVSYSDTAFGNRNKMHGPGDQDTGTISRTCNAAIWGDDHIGRCYGERDVGTKCVEHGIHRNCMRFYWYLNKESTLDSQKLMYVSDAQVYEHNVECTIEDIPLITKLEVDKYVYKVSHTAENLNGLDNAYAASDARKTLEEDVKFANPVYVETEDKVVFRIVLKNSSAFGVIAKVDDILPEGEGIFEFDSALINGKTLNDIAGLRSEPVEVAANGETTVEVTVIIKANPELGAKDIYENKARIITRNSTTKNGDDDIDYIRTIDDNGPIVNHIEPTCQGTTETPDWESSDWVKINNYNVIVDKYVYQYDEAILDINNTAKYTDADSVTKTVGTDSNVIKEYDLRINNSEATEAVSDGNLNDIVQSVNTTLEEFKYNHPLRVEKGEEVTFAIKIINDAKQVIKNHETGVKPATQVKPKLVIDTLDSGLSYVDHTAKLYNPDGSEKYEAIGGAVSVSGSEIKFDETVILNPDEYIIVYMTVSVDDSNMSLDRLSNEAQIKEIANINDVDVSHRNIAKQTSSKDYVVLKDLIIAGHVWVDFNKDGLMNDTYDTNRKELTGVSGTARKENILVTLHNAATKEVLRETRTDVDGMFTFGRDTEGNYYDTFDHTVNVVNSFDKSKLYDRVDKGLAISNKDNFGNYLDGANYSEYYIQYSYDGMIYKSTEIYANQKRLNASTGAISDIKYEIDSNAAEIPEDRKKFNQEHEYISYNQSFDMSKAASSALKYNKEGHASYLVEAEDRVIKATSFIDETSGVIDNLWLYDYKGVGNPETEYLKHINLGLELREDVDIALSKDVYSLTTIVDGEMVEYRYNLLLDELNGDGQGHDYIIDKPYGIELYESDYKKRVDQYESEAVRAHKGIDSELNVDVTYRITLNNVPTTDDDTVPGADDKKLDVNIHEVLDLYDKNFMPYSEDKITVKIKNDNGFLEPVERTISEAWYFKEGAEGTKYRILNASEVALGTEEPFYVEDPSGTYGKVPMTVSNTSEFAQANNDYDSAGYRSMFIRTNSKDEIVLSEGEKFDIYVRYTLDKDAAEVKTTESAYNETKTENSIENKTIMIDGKEYTFAIQTFTETTTDTAILERSLNIAECAANKLNPRGTENIAQINAYSVYYTNKDYPDSIAALVDKDSNAGNVGDGEGIASSNSTSVDNVALYEDTTYKTGIEIIANNTENDLEVLRRKYGGTTITVEEIIPREIELKRNISGKVWDDSKVEATETNEGKIYHGDGSSKTPANKYNEFFGQKDAGGNLINEPPQTNINVEKNYDVATSEPQRKEQVDLSVRNAKAEFIEIVPIPKDPKLAEDDPKQEMHYYEQVLTDVTWTQDQQARTNANGEYNLYGLTPGRYIVRFTYGDTITDEDAKYVTSIDEATKDMQIFNGQDYKSTKYTLNLEDGERDVDKIIQRFMDEGTSDARDDEMRRLAVNQYSEIMTNQKAEVLKGLINNTRGLIDTRYNPLSNNTEDELKVLTDNTYMEAETVEFEIKQEKVLAGQVQKYITYGLDVNNGIYYDEQTIILNEHINERDFDIENVDFGIEYRPESQISLTKEINEMKLTAEDGTLLVDLYFYTTGEGDATEHHIDKEKSKGMDVVQFISNDYLNYNTNALVNKLASEDLQGFVYIQVDDEILQGATVEITYKFYAQNNSEIDLIRKTLDEIRYKENQPTVDLVNDYKAKGYDILDQNYTASGTAENVLFSDMYGLDSFTGNTVTINEYIKLHDDLSNQKDILSAELVKMANEQDITVIENCRNRILELDKQIRDLDARHVYRTTAKVMTSDSGENAGKDGYYGRYVGYAYYTADAIKDASNNLLLDTVACLKFDKILDYIDTDLEYITETNNDLLENRFWKVTNTDELKPYVYALRKGTADLTPVGTLMNREDQEYKALVVSVDDSLYDMNIPERVPANAASLGNGIVNNKDLSRFLKPAISTHVESDTKGFIYLPTSKVISAETGTDNLQYENLAEIVQFTTLTGRRTNFATTIGNADIHATAPSNKGSSEFNTAALEPDTAATETITLTPPTGLMTSRRAIVNIVDTTAKGVGVVTIIAAVVGIAVAVTTVTRLIIKKRRIK